MIILFLVNFSINVFADTPIVTSEAAILIDAETGEVLFEKNSHVSLYPASTTKIMTGILAIENCDLDEEVVIPREATLGIEGSHIALEPGEVLTMENLLYALLIESANDAAKAIAIHISGSVEDFAKLMNEKAKELGAYDTNFVNPNGLHDDNHVTTAYDLSLITRYAMKNKVFANIVKEYLYTIDTTNKKSEPRYLKSSNKMLYSDDEIRVDGKYIPTKYYGAIGVKTGYTPEAKNCLVTAVKRDNHTLITVVLKAVGRNLYEDTHNLMNYGFKNFTLENLAYKNSFIENINVESGNIPFATAVIEKDLKAIVPSSNVNNIKSLINLNGEVKAPITEGQVLGQVDYMIDDELVGSVNIVSATNVTKKTLPPTLDYANEKFLLRKWWTWPIILLLLVIVNLKIRQLRRRRRRQRRTMFV
ncbi:MAG: D-alanyl-D-alanine carboxypeptidase [Firmicutes bacterium]|nr:D-alanyl-D-alanine carboxypeptidase [Bacillota bacterium]